MFLQKLTDGNEMSTIFEILKKTTKGINCMLMRFIILSTFIVSTVLSGTKQTQAELNHEFHWHAALKNSEAVAHSIERGAEINSTDANGNTALHFVAHNASRASVQNCAAIIQLLAKAKADFNAINLRSQTALEIAYEYHSGLPTLHDALLKGGSKPFRQHANGTTDFDAIAILTSVSSKEKLKLLQF